MGTRVYVDELPKCQFCTWPAAIDGKTKYGPWAFMCDTCFNVVGVGIGTGLGQHLILRDS